MARDAACAGHGPILDQPVAVLLCLDHAAGRQGHSRMACLVRGAQVTGQVHESFLYRLSYSYFCQFLTVDKVSN